MPEASLADAHRLAERCREQVMTIDTQRWLTDRRITVSIGLTVSKPTGDSPSSMLQRADAALYEAKRSGRNCVKANVVPQESTDAPAVPRTTEATDMKFA